MCRKKGIDTLSSLVMKELKMCFQNGASSFLFSMPIGKNIDYSGSIFPPHKNYAKKQFYFNELV